MAEPEHQTLLSIHVLCEQFEAAYAAGAIHIRLGPPADDLDGILGDDRFDVRPRLPVLHAERRKGGDPVITIDRGLLA